MTDKKRATNDSDESSRFAADTRPDIRELISQHPRAEVRLHRITEAMELDPEPVYRALEHIQAQYNAFDLATNRPIVQYGHNYVAFQLNVYEWYWLVAKLRDVFDDKDAQNYLTKLTLTVMSDIVDREWIWYSSLPLVLSESEVHEIVCYREEMYEPPSPWV